ncbi:MAG: amidoligase family protein, partial [Candidatus Thorarchaeota archaeon]
MTNKQLWTFVTCWFVLEELVTDMMSGEGRSGNHFCLRAVDAEALLDSISKYLSTGDRTYISGDEIRYSALNLCSLRKFGSLEFRAMRTTTKVYKIKRWINIL